MRGGTGAALLSLFWGLGAGCGESTSGVTRVGASGYFAPDRLDFGEIRVGDLATLDATFTNSSPDDFIIQRIEFEPAREQFMVVRDDGTPLRGVLIPRGARIPVVVRFGASVAGDYSGTMLLVSESLEVAVEIAASAREVKAPHFTLRPGTLEFLGPVAVGADVSRSVVLTNGGESPGALFDLSAAAPFSVTALGGGPALPGLPVAPGASLEVVVHFRPTAAGTFDEVVAFTATGGEVSELGVRGTSMQPGLLTCTPSNIDFGPVARGEEARREVSCSVTPGIYTLASIGIVGGTDLPFAVDRLSSAPGSSIQTLTFEVAYTARGLPRSHQAAVEVRAEHGTVTPIALMAETIPPPPQSTDLTVSLTWNTAGNDLDLHLVRDGQQPFAPTHDCHFETKTLDWNVAGNELDNPFLDSDARRGPGPEVITLREARTGTYDAYVQYSNYDDATGPRSTNATITYHVAGGSAVMRTMAMPTCGDMWHVGTFRFDGASPTFTPADTISTLYRSFTRRCR